MLHAFNQVFPVDFPLKALICGDKNTSVFIKKKLLSQKKCFQVLKLTCQQPVTGQFKAISSCFLENKPGFDCRLSFVY